MSKNIKKILLWIGILLIIGIGGLGVLENKNSRRYMEKHFSYLEKIYPTRNVEDLFEKLPNGGSISYSIDEEGDRTLVYFIDMTIDSKNKKIYGIERKERITRDGDELIYEESVEYKDGYITYPNNPEMEKKRIKFLFEEIDYKDLKNYELKRIRYISDVPIYTVSYWLPDEFYTMFNVNREDSKLYLVLSDRGERNIKIRFSDQES